MEALRYFARWFDGGSLVAFMGLVYDDATLLIDRVVIHNGTTWTMTGTLSLEATGQVVATRVVGPGTELSEPIRGHQVMVADPLGPQEPVSFTRYTTNTTWTPP